MHLEFTSEQEELRASVRDVLERECPPGVVRARVEQGTIATALWEQARSLGWTALTLPESAEGLGLGPVEMVVVAEELGRYAAPIPWLATVTQYAPLVRELADTETSDRLLTPVATGEVTATLAVAEDGRRALPDRLQTTARRTSGGWVLDGVKRFVWDASLASQIAVVAATDDGPAAFVVDATAVDIRPVHTVDASREWAHVVLSSVEVDTNAVIAPPADDGAAAIERAVQEAILAVAVEIVGACARLLEMTVAHAVTRRQFGVPIGSFQAVKHKLADSFVALERARAAAYFAAVTLAENDPRRTTAVPMAKVAAGDCQHRIVQDAIQTFGGIGYTWESDLHLYAKRAKADDAAFGTAHTHRRALATELGLTG